MKEEEEEQKEEGVGDWVITNYKEFKLFILFAAIRFLPERVRSRADAGHKTQVLINVKWNGRKFGTLDHTRRCPRTMISNV